VYELFKPSYLAEGGIMSIRVCRIDELKEHKRGRRSALAGLAEVAQLKLKLSHGLRPYEAVEIELPDKGIKNLRDSFKAHIVKYLREVNILDYEVLAYRSGGKDYVAVVYSPPNAADLEEAVA
jgi:hypothetical protein